MRVLTTAILIALLGASTLADAQSSGKKLYRWTDKDGKVHYSDHVPPEAIENARTEISEKSGMAVKEVDRALTPEELAAAKAKAAEEEAARKAKEEQDKADAVLLGSYGSVQELERSYQERYDLLDQSIASAEAGVKSQEKSLAELLAHAASLERQGKPVPPNIASSIDVAKKQVAQQREYLAKRQAERVELDDEYARIKQRYVEVSAKRGGTP
jgi:chromosome segregation ATPase